LADAKGRYSVVAMGAAEGIGFVVRLQSFRNPARSARQSAFRAILEA